MIYLIDDNKYGQMSGNYRLDFTEVLQSFSEQVRWIQKDLSLNIEMIFSNASCILIHDSVEPKEEKESIVAKAKVLNIPFCLFSNGFTATVYEDYSIKEIKKDRFYNNLLVFITQFKTNGNIQLKLLSLGQNYEAEKAAIIQDRLINGVLFTYRNNFNFSAGFPSGSQDYRDLRELFYLSESFFDNQTFEDAYNAFEEIFDNSSTTAQIMKEKINSLTSKVLKRYEY